MSNELESLRRELAATRAELAEARVYQTGTANILKVIASSPTDVAPALQAIVDSACEVCGAYDVAVILRDGDFMRFSAHRGPIPLGMGGRPLDRGWVGGRAVVDRAPVHVHDLLNAGDEFPEGQDMARRMGHRTILAVPLLREGESVGAIVVRRNEVQPFTDKQIDALSSFADQAVIAIGNVRLFDEVQARTKDLSEALRRQTATSDVLRAIAASPGNVRPVLDRLVETVCALCEAHDAVIMLRDGEDLWTPAHHGPIPVPPNAGRRPVSRNWPPGRSVAEGRTIHVPDLAEAQDEYPLALAISADVAREAAQSAPGSGLAWRTALAAPLMREGEAQGTIVLRRVDVSPFSEAQVALLQTFADQAVIAIENARLFNEVRAKTLSLENALERQTATSKILEVIASSPADATPVFQAIAASANAVTRGHSTAVFRYIGESVHLMAQTAISPEGDAVLRAAFPQALGDFPAFTLARSGQVAQIPDTAEAEDPRIRDISRGRGYRSMVFTPLVSQGRPVGVLSVTRREPGAFGADDIAQMRAFADQAVIAIENQRLFEEVQAKTRDLTESLQQQTATADVLKVISRSAFNLQAVLDTLIRSATELCGAHRGSMVLRDGDLFQYRASSDSAAYPQWIAYLKDHPLRAGRSSATARAILTRATVCVPDILADPEIDMPGSLAHIRAVLAVPMLRDGRVEGVMALSRPEPGRFTARQIELVETFADQAVIAIENARLFEEVQARTREVEKALERQTATAEILKVIASSPADVQPVFDAIVTSAKRLLGAKDSTLTHMVGGRAHLVALTPTNPEVDAARFASFPRSYEDPVVVTISAGQSVLIADAETDESAKTWREVARKTGNRSLVVVPLMSQGKAIGGLSVARAEPGALAEEDLDLLRTFADQAVIAVENARLLNDIREALAQQTATADVLKVISRSGADLDVMLQTLADTAGSFCGNSTIHLQQGGLMRLRVHFGGTPEWIAYLHKRPFPATRATLAGRAWLTGEIVHIPDIPNETDIPWGRAADISGYRSAIAVPIVSRSHGVVGVFSYGGAVPHAFPPRRIELLKSFADQAAIAIDNARLLDEVQARTRELEESLAQQTATAELLKVISRSAFDLEPALVNVCETAARLCNADRVAIYRRDGDLYRFAASYGFPAEYESAWRAAGATRIDPASPLVGHRALSERRAVQVLDVTADPAFFASTSSAADIRTSLGVPLLREGEPVGNFVLSRKRVEAFSPRQLELIQTFADQAVIAIENARLIEEVQARTRDLEEALQIQTATSDVLKVISRSAFELDPIFQTLVATAVDLCKASSGTLCVRDGGVFRYRGMAGPEATTELQRYLEDHPLVAPSRATIAGRVILSRQVEEIHDVMQEAGYAVPFAAHGSPARSLLGVPLLGKTEVQGAIVVTRSEPGAFPRRHLEILRTFADQAVIAIENSRLFEEVQTRTRELEQSLDDLRKAQDRLVQTEKLASLGQLTAGIAHEIKNPLNFVNNFSALSRELLGELKEVIDAHPPPPEPKADVDDLIAMLDSNLEKVVHHGQRADSIVKNMLRHSREGSSERARVSVNAMVEEALNLAYHGARAEKPGFNVTIEKSFDPQAGEVDLYVQEMTRVLLNLISNGFYATEQRKRGEPGGYEPTLTASTRDLGTHTEIRIRDNGTGISDEVKAKMFNPFFTTKPAGEGTGLGLSLSHDIVVKQHGGTIDVTTERGAFTEFVVRLPRGLAK